MASAPNSTSLRDQLVLLRQLRRTGKESNRPKLRRRLSAIERADVLRKTGGRCHICGGLISGASWQADHVLAHSAGGAHAADNYLPAHAMCNNYRWDYVPGEFEVILKLGVWARTQIERGTKIGEEIERQFSRYEVARIGRRKTRNLGDGA